MVFILYAGLRLITVLPNPLGMFASVLAMMVMPAFLAGMMHACRELDQGRRIDLSCLVAGFRRSTRELITLGGIGLAGNMLTLMIIGLLGGDAFQTLARAMGDTAKISPEQLENLREAVNRGARAILLGMLVSLPVVMHQPGTSAWISAHSPPRIMVKPKREATPKCSR